MATWTIEVGGASRKYKTMKFERKLDMNSPTKFTAKVEYSADIDFMNRVVIKRNGTAEWIGYVEGLKSEWDGTTRFLNLAGRDASFIVWKKYLEDFGNYAEKTAGFFGQVNASELLMFMIRTPYSDPLHDAEANPLFPNNKEGWGMDASKLTCSASVTAVGDAQYTTLRMRGLGWRNRGSPFESTTKTVNGSPDIVDWTHTGASPYLDDPSNSKYIKYTVGHDGTNHAIFDLQDAPADLSSINSISLNLYFKHDGSPWYWDRSYFAVYIWIESMDSWVMCFDQECGGGVYTDWTARTWDLTSLIQTKDDLTNARLKFIGRGSLSTYIGYTVLSFSYVKSGIQTTGDHFDINFPQQEIMGIYIESRMDNDSYPRNYKITTTGTREEFGVPPWAEVDPSGHISVSSDKYAITFNSWQNETAYFYKNYPSGMGEFELVFSFMVSSSLPAYYAFIPFCICNNLEDYATLRATGGHYFSGVEIGNEGGSLSVRLRCKTAGGEGWTADTPISLATTYFVKVVRSGTNLIYTVYNNSLMRDIDIILTETFGIGSLDFIYRHQAITANEEDWSIDYLNDMDTSLGWSTQGGTATRSDDAGAQKIVADPEGEYYCFQQNIDPYDEDMVDAFIKIHDDPPIDNINTDLECDEYANWITPPPAYTWGTLGSDPYVRTDSDMDNNHVWCACNITPMSLKNEWAFEDPNSKLGKNYQGFAPNSSSHLVIKARIHDDGSGHPDGAVLSIKLYVYHSDTWVEITQVGFSNTTWETIIDNDISAYWTSLNDWRFGKVKIDLVSISGTAQGEIQVGYIRIHMQGQGAYGSIYFMKLYDHDVIAGPNPSSNYAGAVFVAPDPDATTWQTKWRWGIDYYFNGGTGTVLSDEMPTLDTFYRMRLYVKISSVGDGWVKLAVLNPAETFIAQYTGMTNNTLGQPDRYDYEAEFSALNKGTVWLDWTRVEIKGPTHTLGYVYSDYGARIILAGPVSGNTFRDIIHSWQPVTASDIRIEITADDIVHSWAISQVYLYGTQPLKIRPYLDGLSDPTTARPTPYAGGPYIKAVSVDNDFTAPVGPLNVARGRLLDDLNFVVQKCYDEYYIPFEWWIALDDDNTLHIASQKGSDKSATIIFERGGNLGGGTREKYIDDTVQRVYVVGEGEQKTQQKSSIWVESQEGMDDVRTFYEEVEHEKSLTPNEKGDPEVSRIVGEVYIKKNATRRDQIVVKVTKDAYDSMAYDVGDIVTVIDVLTETDGAYRIMNIDKEINDAGEQITVYLGYPRYRFEDEMQYLYKQLKQLGAVGVIKPDWTAEGIEQTDLSATAVGPTSQFSASAKNEEVDISKDIKNPAWSVDPAPASTDYKDYEYNGAGTGKSYQSVNTPTHGMEWQKTDQWMALLGPDADNNLFILRVAIVGDAAGDALDVAVNRDPKTVFEIRCHNDSVGEHPKVWDIGDSFKMGLAGNNGSLIGGASEWNSLIGFWFFGYYNGSSINLSAMWSTDGINVQSKFIRTLQMNHKYRLEIITQSANGIVLFNVYDIEGSQADEQNPVQMVALIGASQATFTVKPLYVALSSRNVSGQDYRGQLYVYRYECSWIRVLPS